MSNWPNSLAAKFLIRKQSDKDTVFCVLPWRWKQYDTLQWNLSCNTQLPVAHWLSSRSEWGGSRDYHEISALTLATTAVSHIRKLTHNRSLYPTLDRKVSKSLPDYTASSLCTAAFTVTAVRTSTFTKICRTATHKPHSARLSSCSCIDTEYYYRLKVSFF
jgi:hypothetical protein